MKRILTLTIFVVSLAVGVSLCQQRSGSSGQSPGEQTAEATPRNIVLMIGDGMGVTQIYAGMTVSKEPLVFEQFRNIGFQKTYSKDNYITDSGASGTALATGEKTNNGRIAVSPSGEKLTTILELAEQQGLASGLVSTSSIVHATPASFIAHNRDRGDYDDLAADFLETDIDVFIGGGRKHFASREDGKDLIKELKEKNYQVLYDMDRIKEVKEGKLAGLTAEGHNPKYSEGRGDMLPEATQTALNILDNNREGFFLMVEGSQIDWGGHDNDPEYIVNELLDFERAVQVAINFAQKNPNTLVIVTADHETGGMGLNGGDINKHTVESGFTTAGHTGVMVPVFAFGPGAEQFGGIYDNTDVFKKMRSLYGF